MTEKVLIIHGPNLNLLGKREPGIYGSKTLDDINAELAIDAANCSIDVEFFQSNGEGALVDRIQACAGQGIGYIVINAGAYTHTSVAIRDALAAVAIPFIEVHISNVYQREAFRHKSYLSDAACGVIAGFGADGYRFALQHAAKAINE